MLAILLVAMFRMVPGGRDVEAIARAIVDAGATWTEATWLAAVGYREGSYQLGIVGDQGRALCTFQLHNAPREVLTDAGRCARIALRRLRHSMTACPSAPLAEYAGAPCASRVAGRISRDRDALRRRMFGGGEP